MGGKQKRADTLYEETVSQPDMTDQTRLLDMTEGRGVVTDLFWHDPALPLEHAAAVVQEVVHLKLSLDALLVSVGGHQQVVEHADRALRLFERRREVELAQTYNKKHPELNK